MKLNGEVLGQFEATDGGDWVAGEHGEIHVAARRAVPFACEPKRYRAMRPGTDFPRYSVSA